MVGRQIGADLTTSKVQHGVSVVVPCYRCKDTICRAVESVVAQSVPPLEVILVDDASGDGTIDVLRRLASEPQPRFQIRLLELPRNVGAAGARNAGWEAARGEYVAFLDADATWHADKLKLQGDYMAAHPDVAVCGHRHAIVPLTLPPGVGPTVAEPIGFSQLVWSNRFVTSAAMVRRDLPIRFPQGQRHMEDHRLWLDIARAGHQIVRLQAVLAAHHKPEFGASGLSADLLAMEKAELGNYREMAKAGAISGAFAALLSIWSLGKFFRRLLIVRLRRASSERNT